MIKKLYIGISRYNPWPFKEKKTFTGKDILEASYQWVNNIIEKHKNNINRTHSFRVVIKVNDGPSKTDGWTAITYLKNKYLIDIITPYYDHLFPYTPKSGNDPRRPPGRRGEPPQEEYK